MLSKDKFIQFKSLKAVARGLQFKYFCHRGGRFLAKFDSKVEEATVNDRVINAAP